MYFFPLNSANMMQTVYLMKFCENKKIKSCKQVIKTKKMKRHHNTLKNNFKISLALTRSENVIMLAFQ